jgi:hypothetical protein
MMVENRSLWRMVIMCTFGLNGNKKDLERLRSNYRSTSTAFTLSSTAWLSM